ncbi:hypothetical protein AVEN_206620-1 [Araneus ventricosus]|uniref:Uncharacterized protein n=1 Tax=Araneus ventricosus TaxID=182803 RepID=A0A4Y2KJB5_ARAVE|nr:hypothetical protein AVEN_206620-1 [Araneus ventricosus]
MRESFAEVTPSDYKCPCMVEIPKLGYYAGYSSEVHKIAQDYLFKDTGDAPLYLQRNRMKVSFVEGEQKDVFAKCFSERLHLFHGDAALKTMHIAQGAASSLSCQTNCVNYDITWMKNNRTGPRSQEYVNCDKDIMTSKSFTIDELTEDKFSEANLTDDEVMPLFLKDAMNSVENFELVSVGLLIDIHNTSSKTK